MTDAHENFLKEIVAYAESIGCTAGSPCAYHDLMPEQEKRRMASDYSPAALAVRLRADRRIWHPSGSGFIPVDAKTSQWHLQFPVEALQIAYHLQDGDGCLLAMRSIGSRKADRGVMLKRSTVAGIVKEIRVPTGFRRNGETIYRTGPAANCQDSHEFYAAEFARAFPGIPSYVVTAAYGSGDPFAVIDTDVFNALPDWRSVLEEWAGVEAPAF